MEIRMGVGRADDRHARLSSFWGARFYVHPRLAILCTLLCGLAGQSARANDPDAKNVLFLLSTVKYSQEYLNVVEPEIRARFGAPITFYDAFLEDSTQVEEESYRESIAETFRRRYGGMKVDVLVVANPQAFYFALEYRDRLFPGVPIVFISINKSDLEAQKNVSGLTGVVTPLGYRETIDLALRLQPDTKAVAVVAGITSWDSRQLGFLHSELDHYRDRVKVIDLVGPSNRQLLKRVAELPPHTVLIFQVMPQTSSQEDFGAWDFLSAVAKRIPTYSVFPRLCLNGCIGGAFEDHVKEWKQQADLAARVLSGERTGDIPIVYNMDLQDRVDWQALRRWKIPESALPAGSVVLNRPPSFWASYRNYMIAAIVVIAVLLLLVIGLVWQRARNRKAEALLSESEKRFKVMADTTPALIWMCDSGGKITYLNDRRVAFTGPDPKAGYGDTWIGYVHPDDQRNVLDAVAEALKTRHPFSKEYRLRRSDGVYRWMLDIATPRVNGDGSFAGFIGSAIDTTDQKLAQQALEKVSGQMIEAQEKERSRIARDLHDDICQRLALLSMEIDQAKRVSADSPETTKEKLQEIRKHCSEITGDVQSLSHQLHSSKLESLGIEAAIRGFCREVSRQHEVNVDFTCRNVPKHLPKAISLCLFRVAQEALQNAVKYSGVSEFTVELLTLEDEIHLAVADEGAGFDVEEAKRNQGLGLMSMQERVQLVNGMLSVESNPGKGTQVLAVVPLDGRPLKDQAGSETTSMAGMA
jgi:PAS domain S-box-containing protein